MGVAHFSCGAKAKHDVMVKAGIGVGTYAKIASKRRDSDSECLRQKRGSRNNIKNTDWPGAEQEKGMKT